MRRPTRREHLVWSGAIDGAASEKFRIGHPSRVQSKVRARDFSDPPSTTKEKKKSPSGFTLWLRRTQTRRHTTTTDHEQVAANFTLSASSRGTRAASNERLAIGGRDMSRDGQGNNAPAEVEARARDHQPAVPARGLSIKETAIQFDFSPSFISRHNLSRFNLRPARLCDGAGSEWVGGGIIHTCQSFSRLRLKPAARCPRSAVISRADRNIRASVAAKS